MVCQTTHFSLSRNQCCVFTDDECGILPRIPLKNHLHEALENQCFEEASRYIGSEGETHLVECFGGKLTEKFHKSCLHLIAAMRDPQQANKLCSQLLERIRNRKNREYLLNMTTVDEFDMVGWKVRARVAAIHIAAYNGNPGVVRLLCQEYGVDVNCSMSETLEEVPKKGITVLEWAARMGHTEVMKALLENKANVNVRRPADGITPLHIAALVGRTEVVKLLLEHNADVNVRCIDKGATPLYIAAQEGHTEMAKLLLDNNADVNLCKHTDGTTPLYIAAQKGHIEVVKLLLDNNADVNASRRTDGATPLHTAAENGNTEVVKLLLDIKAKRNAKARSGKKPVDAARRNQHWDIVQLLK